MWSHTKLCKQGAFTSVTEQKSLPEVVGGKLEGGKFELFGVFPSLQKTPAFGAKT